MVWYCMILSIGTPIVVLVLKLIYNTELKLKFEELRVYQNLKTSNFIKDEHLKIYQKLAEGIITIKNGKVDYTNQIAEDIIMDL